MKIMGISFDYHDAAAALIVDGSVVAACQEERFTRRKHDARLPVNAMEFCLGQAGIAATDLDLAVYYEDPLAKYDRIVSVAMKDYPRHQSNLNRITAEWLASGKFQPEARISAYLGIPQDKIRLATHHDSHAAAAFYCSPFEEATVVTIDAVGEYQTASWAIGRGTEIKRLGSVSFPNSIGLFYSAFTSFLGFEVNEGEYKVMGLSAYGQPKYAEEMKALFNFTDHGGFVLDQKYFSFDEDYKRLYSPKLVDWLGSARDSSAEFVPPVIGEAPRDNVQAASKHFADIAASVQECLEDVVVRFVRMAVEQTGLSSVCLAGGVALNGLANSRLIHQEGISLYVQPASGDSGSAIGAAAIGFHAQGGGRRMDPLTSAFLGPEYDDCEIEAALCRAGLRHSASLVDEAALIKMAVSDLDAGKVIGWFNGRAEWGPRALGNRSILADPRRLEMKEVVNQRVKYREGFRPFAPVVTAEAASRFFHTGPYQHETAPERFMLAVHQVVEKFATTIPAVTHIDNTARIQIVDRKNQPLFYDLIKQFEALTGIPILLNTSFNLRGEPIVTSPDDALRTFMFSGLDKLYIGRWAVKKDFTL
jgi:carbamoyltransferase